MTETHETEPVLSVRRRDGTVVAFDRTRIERAIASAFLRDANGEPRHVGGNELLPAEREKVQRFTEQVVHAVSRRPDATQHPVDIEDIQDQVELALMRYGEHAIARDYVLYRERRRQVRSTRPAVCAVGSGECEACQ
jgi:ribonucleoside-diphosphate reductase alpha chain